MKYFSLFSGIGGFELGIQQAYESNFQHAPKCEEPKSEERTQGGFRTSDEHEVQLCSGNRSAPLCVGYSEIDRYAVQIYESHFKHKNYGDITKIEPKGLPDFQLLCGGFPCQSFSIAGKRGGFEDTRGTLFFDIANIAKHKKPNLLLLENVRGLLSHEDGRTFNTIIYTLTELGYDLQWQVLNSKNFGVPQNRERVFIIGHLRNGSRPQVFPFGENDPVHNTTDQTGKGRPQAKHSGTVRPDMGSKADSTFIKTKRVGGLYDKPDQRHQAGSIFDPTGISPTLETAQGGNRQPFILNPKMKDFKEKDTCPALTASDYKEPKVVNAIRRLTPTECERLQGFPDGWTQGLSDSQRYKTLGNAVTVNVIREIMKRLL